MGGGGGGLLVLGRGGTGGFLGRHVVDVGGVGRWIDDSGSTVRLDGSVRAVDGRDDLEEWKVADGRRAFRSAGGGSSLCLYVTLGSEYQPGRSANQRRPRATRSLRFANNSLQQSIVRSLGSRAGPPPLSLALPFIFHFIFIISIPFPVPFFPTLSPVPSSSLPCHCVVLIAAWTTRCTPALCSLLSGLLFHATCMTLVPLLYCDLLLFKTYAVACTRSI